MTCRYPTKDRFVPVNFNVTIIYLKDILKEPIPNHQGVGGKSQAVKHIFIDEMKLRDQILTLDSNSWLSGGCLLKLCGNITVSSSGFSARSAPLITAALVPDAPDVKIWFFWK